MNEEPASEAERQERRKGLVFEDAIPASILQKEGLRTC